MLRNQAARQNPGAGGKMRNPETCDASKRIFIIVSGRVESTLDWESRPRLGPARPLHTLAKYPNDCLLYHLEYGSKGDGLSYLPDLEGG